MHEAMIINDHTDKSQLENDRHEESKDCRLLDRLACDTWSRVCDSFLVLRYLKSSSCLSSCSCCVYRG